MKNPNPIIPPGMNLDKSHRGRSNMRIAVLVIVLVHIALFGGILFNACSQKSDDVAENAQPEEDKVTRDTSLDIPPPRDGDSNFDSHPETVSELGLGTADSPAGVSGPAGSLSFGGEGIDAPPLAAVGASPEGTTGLGVSPSTGGTFKLPASPSPATIEEHTILSGEHFTSIAKKYRVSVRAIQEANPSLDSRRLRIGQKVKIPPVTVVAPSVGTDAVPLAVDEYVIQRGDSLSAIAQRHSTTVKALRAANGLKTDLILAGKKLKLPAGSAFSSPVPSAGTGSLPASLPGTE
jgi:LysM repeat protein